MRTLVWAKKMPNKMPNIEKGRMFDMEHNGDHKGLHPLGDVIEDRPPQIPTYRIIQRDKAFGEVVPEDVPKDFD